MGPIMKALMERERPIPVEHVESVAKNLAEELAANAMSDGHSYQDIYHKTYDVQETMQSKIAVLEQAGWCIKDMAFHEKAQDVPQKAAVHMD